MLGKKRKKKERNHPCPSVYNLVGEINNTNKITEDIWNYTHCQKVLLRAQRKQRLLWDTAVSYRFMEEVAI